MTDEERLADIEARLEAFRAPYSTLAVRRADLDDYRWLAARVRALTDERDALVANVRRLTAYAVARAEDLRALTAERDALLVDRDAWKARVVPSPSVIAGSDNQRHS